MIQLILIQSLYTSWKDEEVVEKRLRDLNMTAIPIPRESLPQLNSQYYQNNAYDNSEEINMTLKRYTTIVDESVNIYLRIFLQSDVNSPYLERLYT